MQLTNEAVQQSSLARRGECEIYPQDPNALINVRSGKAIAIRLANDGYDVCINDVQANKSGCDEVVKEIQTLGRKSFAYTADVSNLKEVQGLVQASVKELGPLNTMVANAGIAQVKALLDLTPDDLSRMFQVNGIAANPGSYTLILTNSSVRCLQLLLNCRKTDDISGQWGQVTWCSQW